MPEKRNLFSQAENDRYNVSNVLRDPGSDIAPQSKAPEKTDDVEINVEEGAPFLEGIDPDATIGEYMQLNDEEEAEARRREAAAALHAEETAEAPVLDAAPIEEAAGPKEGPQSQAIRQQAEKARASFIDDLASLESEPAIQGVQHSEDENSEPDDLAGDAQDLPEEEAPEIWEEDLDETEAEEKEPLSFKDLARRIKKPRFVKKEIEPAADDPEHLSEEEAPAEPGAEETQLPDQGTDGIMRSDDNIAEDGEEDSLYEEELAEARASQKAHSICEDLYQLQQLLEEGRSPFMHKTEVLVPRERTLRLIRSLTAICEVNPSYIDSASEERFAEDQLIDELVSEHTEDDYRPLERARDRAQAIIRNATKQADTILGDARTLARQLLAETEAEIQEKFDAADEQIAVRMTTTKEESTKKLNEARSELTVSRQRSVEILSKYLEKAENDYQGYWERAENTVMASLEQSESILAKAADIYRKELLTIHQDKEEIDEILEHLKKYRKHSPKR